MYIHSQVHTQLLARALQELRWESNRFEFLIAIDKVKNPLGIGFLERGLLTQNMLDYPLVTVDNESNPFV
jgi:hypothetical protein